MGTKKLQVIRDIKESILLFLKNKYKKFDSGYAQKGVRSVFYVNDCIQLNEPRRKPVIPPKPQIQTDDSQHSFKKDTNSQELQELVVRFESSQEVNKEAEKQVNSVISCDTNESEQDTCRQPKPGKLKLSPSFAKKLEDKFKSPHAQESSNAKKLSLQVHNESEAPSQQEIEQPIVHEMDVSGIPIPPPPMPEGWVAPRPALSLYIAEEQETKQPIISDTSGPPPPPPMAGFASFKAPLSL